MKTHNPDNERINIGHSTMPAIPEERLAPIRSYLRAAFPDWELAERWDGDHEAHAFRLTKCHEPVHLLRVSRNVLDDNEPDQLAALVAQRGVAQALRNTDGHHILLTTHGLESF